MFLFWIIPIIDKAFMCVVLSHCTLLDALDGELDHEKRNR